MWVQTARLKPCPSQTIYEIASQYPVKAAFAGGFFNCANFMGGFMSDVEEVESAEAKMNAAKEALLSYVEGRTSMDGEQYRRLVARVKKTEREFMRAVEDLDK